MILVWLVVTFLVTAVLYSSVGFGGGSTYTALLVFSGLQISLVPIVSLACNLTVTSTGTWKAQGAGLYEGSDVWPILAFSVPAAFLGGLTPIGDQNLIILLGLSLLFASLHLGWNALHSATDGSRPSPVRSRWIAPVVGAGIGYLSGLVGIGGGIFLAPVLHMLNWNSPRKIAALATAYIAANSLAGLVGKTIALADRHDLSQVLAFWPLVPAVLIGSWIGHRFMLGIFPERLVKGLTAVLIIVVAVRLLLRGFGGS
ncbi:MAG: sulfite exporter TauE/SafE family protein [Hyphomonadaceae bacterium]|nr:sulfite exporter TauE/SafE family protein [Hyphomonadaceae bacterium]